MNATPIYFDSNITLADLAAAVESIGCHLEVERAQIRVVPAPVVFEPLPVPEVEDLTYSVDDLPAFLRRQAD
jgi:hypothetical protein